MLNDRFVQTLHVVTRNCSECSERRRFGMPLPLYCEGCYDAYVDDQVDFADWVCEQLADDRNSEWVA